MKFTSLKKLRVVISLIFFLATTILFLDLSGWSNDILTNNVLFYQFIPSLLSFIAVPSLMALGFVLVLILTLLFGRVYCSTVCPLGILQDIIIYLKQKNSRRRKYKFSNPRNILRYSILGFAILFLVVGSSYILLLLEPYSNFGRIITFIIKPVVVTVNNIVSLGFEQFDSFIVAPAKHSPIQLFSLIFSVAILITIVVLSVRKGRIFCNTLCPVGAFLGIISKYSLFKIAVDKDNCNGCGVCERVCKATCIASGDKYIDFTRCIGCFNCFNVCPSNGLKFELQIGKSKIAETNNTNSDDSGRRTFLTSLALFSLSSSIVSYAQNKIAVYKKNEIPILKTNATSPPGSLGNYNMTAQCTACQLCVSVCPSKVLQPSFLEYGFTGMMQPHMDNKVGYCDYECTLCSEVCPTGAIQKITKSQKRSIQIGKVRFIEDNCVVKTQGTDCGACSEHCPTKAVEMYPYEKNPKIRIPVVKEELCVGCGACEHACPTIPYKAIWVESNIEHQIAELPKEEKIEEEVDYEEDFPF